LDFREMVWQPRHRGTGDQMSDLSTRVKAVIRDVPDFPKPGILFKDITPVLADPALMRDVIGHFTEAYAGQGIDVVVGMESRGFIFGAPLAMALNAAFAPARKPGKLPYDRISEEYALEYGTARLDMHIDAVKAGQRVLVIDDLIATGGTAAATAKLVERLGATVVGLAFVIELRFLDGRALLAPRPVMSLASY
jgi:adenine phosphoribosyltransferase